MRTASILSLIFFTSILQAASIINFSSGGGFTLNFLSSAPASVVEGNFESNTAYTAFVEKEQFVLPVNVDLDIDTPGTFGSPSGGTILAGTVVDSIFIRFDTASGTVSPNGTFTFDQDVIGIQALSGTLTSFHSVLGADGTTYGSNQIGITGSDRLTLSSDLRSVTANHSVGDGGIDHFRVIFASTSAPVPEPSSLLLLGLSALFLIRSRKL